MPKIVASDGQTDGEIAQGEVCGPGYKMASAECPAKDITRTFDVLGLHSLVWMVHCPLTSLKTGAKSVRKTNSRRGSNLSNDLKIACLGIIIRTKSRYPSIPGMSTSRLPSRRCLHHDSMGERGSERGRELCLTITATQKR